VESIAKRRWISCCRRSAVMLTSRRLGGFAESRGRFSLRSALLEWCVSRSRAHRPQQLAPPRCFTENFVGVDLLRAVSQRHGACGAVQRGCSLGTTFPASVGSPSAGGVWARWAPRVLSQLALAALTPSARRQRSSLGCLALIRSLAPVLESLGV